MMHSLKLPILKKSSIPKPYREYTFDEYNKNIVKVIVGNHRHTASDSFLNVNKIF